MKPFNLPRMLVLRFVLVFSLLASFAQAQVIVDGVDINQLKEGTICSIEISEPAPLNPLTLRLDYGQKSRWADRKMAIEDPGTGKAIRFNSSMEVVNFMIDQGWEYLQAVYQSPKTAYEYRFFFRKKTQAASSNP